MHLVPRRSLDVSSVVCRLFFSCCVVLLSIREDSKTEDTCSLFHIIIQNQLTIIMSTESSRSTMSSFAVNYLIAKFPFSGEFQSFFMALQGVMKVRDGPNKSGKMNWFHAFLQGVVLSYGGGLFTPLWMGRPTPMLSNDLCMASCIIAYVLVNCLPFKIGYKMSSLFPMRLVTTMGAQLFRTIGMLNFVKIAYEAFKDSPSTYYPIPVFGPIVYGTILGNMGSFFTLGFEGHLKGGIPLPFQNGLFLTTIYHFIVHDIEGPIGAALRSVVQPISMGLGPQEFAALFVSVFMQSWAIMQMPEFFGPSFNPFNAFLSIFKLGKKTKRIKPPLESINNSSDSKKNKKSKKTNGSKKKQN